jgi:hypothetical protein
MSGKKTRVSLDSVDAPPIVKVVQVPVAFTLAAPGGSAAYQNGRVTNGYGRAAEVTIRIPYGISVDLNVDLTVHAISYERFDEWHTLAQQTYSSYDWHYLNEHYDASAEAAGWFGGFFGGASASGDYNHYKNSSDQFRSEASQQSDGIIKTIYNLDDDVLKVTGKITGTGLLVVPAEVTVFIAVTKIVFADGKTVTAIDSSNPIAATPDGDATGVSTKPGKVNVVKI